MAKEELIETEGVVIKIIPGGKYLVEIDNGVEIEAHPSGKMRKNKINVLVNDRVTMQMTPYDLTKGRITFRHKQKMKQTSPFKCKETGAIRGYETCTSQVDEDWVPKCNCTDSCQMHIKQFKNKELLTAEAA